MLVARPDENSATLAMRLSLQRLGARPAIKSDWLEEPNEIVAALGEVWRKFVLHKSTLEGSTDFTPAGKQRRLRELAVATAEEIERIVAPIRGYDDAIAKIRRQASKPEPPSELAQLLAYFRQAEIRASLADKDTLELRFLAEQLIRDGEDDETLRALVDSPVRMLDAETLSKAKLALESRNLPDDVKRRVEVLESVRSLILGGVQEIRRELEAHGLPADDPLVHRAGAMPSTNGEGEDTASQ